MKYRRILSSVVVASAAIAAMAIDNIAEEVAWVVGDEPIYKSEIEEQYMAMQQERQSINGDPYCVIPEQMAIEKLFLHQADLDTVEVAESQVQQAVDSRLNYMITNLGTREKVEQMFNMTYPEIREKLATNMRNQYRVSEVQRNLTKDLKITPADVRRYFNALPSDSVPFVPMQVEVQIITHDMNSVLGIGENIVFINKGYREWVGNKEKIFHADNEALNEFVFATDLFQKVKDYMIHTAHR